jgi:hypothetical protein
MIPSKLPSSCERAHTGGPLTEPLCRRPSNRFDARPGGRGEQQPRQADYPWKRYGDAKPLSEGEDFGELARRCRRLAMRCYRLVAVAFDPVSSDAFKRWGDELMAQADALDQAAGEPEGKPGGA